MAALAVLASCVVPGDGMHISDVMATKVWLDQHLFNGTLRTTKREDGGKVFLTDAQKAEERGVEVWPPTRWPTLCFLGVGAFSVEYLTTVALLFPELQLVLMDVQDERWAEYLEDQLGDKTRKGRIERASIEDFAEARGAARRICDGISWSLDTPPFSFYRYRELFYSTDFPLALWNLQGCTDETKTKDADQYYCWYLLAMYQATLCGKVKSDKSAGVFAGEEIFFPMVNTECIENICMCHAHADAYVDVFFEHLCGKGRPQRFMGQWGQDEFIVNNIFSKDALEGQGVYVDVGTSHPYHLSNTAYFDQCLGWRGVCVEPNPLNRPVIGALRTCEVVTNCAYSEERNFTFAKGGELSAIVPGGWTDDDPDDWNSPTYRATCHTLERILLDAIPKILGPQEAASRGRRVDLLSVDAEGVEIDIFKDFPFKDWDIRCIIVETSRRTSMAIDSLLLPRGYLKVAVLGKDAVYVARSMVDRLPTEGLTLPRQIQWNEPGSESDFTEYMRFQRFFGVEGDLDDDVGDQRLLNETELERQSQRTDAMLEANRVELVARARHGNLGILNHKKKESLANPRVQELLRDVEVKQALVLFSTAPDVFVREVTSKPRLRAKMLELADAGVISPDLLGPREDQYQRKSGSMAKPEGQTLLRDLSAAEG